MDTDLEQILDQRVFKTRKHVPKHVPKQGGERYGA